MDNKYFYCYDFLLTKKLIKNGHKVIEVKLGKKHDDLCFVFVSNDELSYIVTNWK